MKIVAKIPGTFSEKDVNPNTTNTTNTKNTKKQMISACNSML
jgi:hypothetical protein